MGLQHCFAMVGGLITPPLVVFRFSVCGFPYCPHLEQYAVSAALIASGICTLINVTQIKIPFTEKIFGRQMRIGSGLLSVMGVSFTFLPIFQSAIGQMKNEGIDGREAYGKLLGTACCCCLLEVLISFLPVDRIKSIFPPIVTSITVILIGAALTGEGMQSWGGGSTCAVMGWKTDAQVVDLPGLSEIPSPVCATYNGEPLYYGAPQYIGLGFSVLVFLVVLELFGSVFLKNCNVVVALMFGYMVAGVSNYNGAPYVNSENIKTADAITFVWTETFPLGFYGPAVFPMLITYLVTTVETVGDLTGTYRIEWWNRLSPNTQAVVSLVHSFIIFVLCPLFSILGGLEPQDQQSRVPHCRTRRFDLGFMQLHLVVPHDFHAYDNVRPKQRCHLFDQMCLSPCRLGLRLLAYFVGSLWQGCWFDYFHSGCRIRWNDHFLVCQCLGEWYCVDRCCRLAFSSEQVHFGHEYGGGSGCHDLAVCLCGSTSLAVHGLVLAVRRLFRSNERNPQWSEHFLVHWILHWYCLCHDLECSFARRH